MLNDRKLDKDREIKREIERRESIQHVLQEYKDEWMNDKTI